WHNAPAAVPARARAPPRCILTDREILRLHTAKTRRHSAQDDSSREKDLHEAKDVRDRCILPFSGASSQLRGSLDKLGKDNPLNPSASRRTGSLLSRAVAFYPEYSQLGAIHNY